MASTPAGQGGSGTPTMGECTLDRFVTLGQPASRRATPRECTMGATALEEDVDRAVFRAFMASSSTVPPPLHVASTKARGGLDMSTATSTSAQVARVPCWGREAIRTCSVSSLAFPQHCTTSCREQEGDAAGFLRKLQAAQLTTPARMQGVREFKAEAS